MFNLLPMILGAGIGAATNKKPLKGALLGGTLGHLSGGLLNSPMPETAEAVDAGGLLGGVTAKMKEIQPVLSAINTGQQVAGQFQDEQQLPLAPPPLPSIGGAEALSRMAGQGQEYSNNIMQQAEADRKKRRQSFLGGY